MTKIPETLADLPEVPVCINMEEKVRGDQFVSVNDIKDDTLKLVFQQREDEAEQKIFKMGMDNKWEQGFQYDLLMQFWLSIHMGNK